MGKISDKEFVDILGSDALLGQKDGCYKNVRTQSLIDLIRDNFKSSVDLFYNGVALKTDIPQSDKGWWFASEKGEYLNFANVTIGENNLPVVTPIVNNADLSIISIDKDGRYQIKTIVQSFADSYNALTQQYIQQYINSLAEVQADLQDATKILYNDDTLAVDIIKRVDKNTGEDVNYRETIAWYDGSLMTDAKADGYIYKKIGDKFYKKATTSINVSDFGADITGLNDSSDAFQIAINFCNVTGNDLNIDGKILVTKTIFIDRPTDSKHFSKYFTIFGGEIEILESVKLFSSNLVGVASSQLVKFSAVTFNGGQPDWGTRTFSQSSYVLKDSKLFRLSFVDCTFLNIKFIDEDDYLQSIYL